MERREGEGHASDRHECAAPLVRMGAGVGGASASGDLDRAGRFAAHHDSFAAGVVALARLEAQARVVASEPVGVLHRPVAPFLVAHEQEVELGVNAAPRVGRQLGHHAERDRVASLHVDRPRAVDAVADVGRGTMLSVRDHRVEMSDEHDPGGARTPHGEQEVVFEIRARRRQAENACRRDRGDARVDGPSGADGIAVRRRDVDEDRDEAQGTLGDRRGESDEGAGGCDSPEPIRLAAPALPSPASVHSVRSLLLPLLWLLAVATPASGAAAQTPTPRPWPLERLELGLADQPGGAKQLASGPRVRLRYQYLAGGVNTPNPWTTWGDHFVEDYVRETAAAGLIPVFTFYEIRQSLPGGDMGDEVAAVLGNLRSRSTMRAYFENLRELFRRITDAGLRVPVVVHVEPDLWGFVQQRFGDDASAAPAEVGATGLPELAGLPDTAAGLAQAVTRLRDREAPGVVLGYHASIWGTGKDITISNESARSVDALATRAAAFYASLGASFDAVFGEFADRTSGFALAHGGDRSAWWNAADFRRHLRFFDRLHRATDRPIVLWQIPLGNRVMRSMDNTTGHFQDNRAEWLLDGRDGWARLRAYRDAGVAALLFGSGQGGDTTARDEQQDGVTNPAPVNGNRRRAKRADDDGGYFRERSRAYVRRGKLARR